MKELGSSGLSRVEPLEGNGVVAEATGSGAAEFVFIPEVNLQSVIHV